MRLLIGARPDVDLPMMKEAAFPAKRSVVRGPRFQDQIVRLPEALAHPQRARVGRGNLVGHAAHEADLDSSARQIIDHRHLLGHAHGLAAVGDRIAEQQQSRAAGLARQHAEHDRRGGVEAGRGLMMLVEHEVQPHAPRRAAIRRDSDGTVRRRSADRSDDWAASRGSSRTHRADMAMRVSVKNQVLIVNCAGRSAGA